MSAYQPNNPDIPTPGRVLVSAEDLAKRVTVLGREITADYAGRSPLLVGVLKG
ncbi:MAG: hypoxanthine phosphoribosyltransferase, partial [Actinobacteria bacterium]|nr:hypoxanthine phosphoribosyltransferase [Actinomycetota bacterium]